MVCSQELKDLFVNMADIYSTITHDVKCQLEHIFSIDIFPMWHYFGHTRSTFGGVPFAL